MIAIAGNISRTIRKGKYLLKIVLDMFPAIAIMEIYQPENNMSGLAKALFELLRLSEGGPGTLTRYLLAEVASELISEGVALELPGVKS